MLSPSTLQDCICCEVNKLPLQVAKKHEYKETHHWITLQNATGIFPSTFPPSHAPDLCSGTNHLKPHHSHQL